MAEGDIADNWEDFDDSGALDKQLEQFQKVTILKKPPSQPVVVEDSTRTNFQPTVKILKRQQQPETDNKPTRSNVSSKQPMSLAEREAAYAEARQRIFGPSSSTTTTPSPAPAPVQQPESNNLSGTSNAQVTRMSEQLERVRVTIPNVTRQPRGPDGSHGFPQYRHPKS